MYETRNELKKIIEKLHKDLNSCEVALERTRTDQEEFQEKAVYDSEESQEYLIPDLIDRIDVLEDLVCTICHLVKGPNDYLKNKAKEVLDEKADRGGSNG